MANEYKVNALQAEVVMTPQTNDGRVYALSVEVVRSIASVATSTRRKQVMHGSL